MILTNAMLEDGPKPGRYPGKVVKIERPEIVAGKLVVSVSLNTETMGEYRVQLWFSVSPEGKFMDQRSARAYQRLCEAFSVEPFDTDDLVGREAEIELRVYQGRSKKFYDVYPVPISMKENEAPDTADA